MHKGDVRYVKVPYLCVLPPPQKGRCTHNPPFVRLDPSAERPMHTDDGRQLAAALVCVSTPPRRGRCTSFTVASVHQASAS
jgi:hypothetical protein